MDREIRDVIIGTSVMLFGAFAPLTVVTLLGIQVWIGLLLAVIVTGVGVWMVVDAFLRYRWVEFKEFARTAIDVFMPKGAN
jgi:hypothetical protein